MKLNESSNLVQLLTTFERLAERQRANQQEEYEYRLLHGHRTANPMQYRLLRP
jgi:hypothetical protein